MLTGLKGLALLEPDALVAANGDGLFAKVELEASNSLVELNGLAVFVAVLVSRLPNILLISGEFDES